MSINTTHPPKIQASSPWRWIPSLYISEGLPYFAIVMLSVVMYKRLGLSNAEIAFYTAWLYLPWVIKPLWSPFIELLGTRRLWIIATQLLLGAGLAGIALTLPTDNFFRYTLAFFWLLAFSSATHDIAADGFYLLALNPKQQAFFVGIRATFYRVAMIFGQGVLVILAGRLEKHVDIVQAWQITFAVVALLLFLFSLYHIFNLPKVDQDRVDKENLSRIWHNTFQVFKRFFQKENILISIAFLLTYRLGEAQLVRLSTPFMLDERTVGGLALSTEQVGWIYGTLGVGALLLGGILGGILLSRQGLRFWLLWMLLAINLPNGLYIYLAWAQPESLPLISLLVMLEQLGYGFGFSAYMLYMIHLADGAHKTAHFALATGFMAAGMMLPGLSSGYLQELWGYTDFFIWVLLSALPAFLLLPYLPLNRSQQR